MRRAMRLCAARIASKFGASVCKEVAFMGVGPGRSLGRAPRDGERHFRRDAVFEPIGDLQLYSVFARRESGKRNVIIFLWRIGEKALRNNDHPLAGVNTVP